MFYLVTYDINQDHDEVKAQCIQAGFLGYIPMTDGSRKQLPNTTLIVEASSAYGAVEKFKDQVVSVAQRGLVCRPIRVVRVIAVQYAEAFIEDNEVLPKNALEEYAKHFIDDSEISRRNALADFLRKKSNNFV